MGISQSGIALLYCYAVLIGFALGLFYDGLRIIRIFFGERFGTHAADRLRNFNLPRIGQRKERKKKRRLLAVVLFAEDFLFCILSGVSFILLFYEANNGKIRVLAPVCGAVGFLCYRVSLGRAVMSASEVIAFGVETAFRYLWYGLSAPLRWLAGKIQSFARARIAKWREARAKKSRERFTARVMETAERNGCGLCGTVMGQKGKERRDASKKGKETVQSESSSARFSGRHRRGFHYRVRHGDHALQ